MSFKVGDKVRCVRPDGDGILVKNRIYIVTDSTANGTDELVMLKGICSPGRNTSYFANRFELVVEEPPKFKVGDKVRCVKKDIFLNVGEVSVGEVYTVAASNIGDSDFCIRVEEVKGAYWMCCFELATEEIKVGDVFVNKHLGVFKVYDTSTPNIGIRVQLENGTLIYVSPELLKGKTPTDRRDRVPNVGKNLFEPKQHICMPRNAGRNFAMEEIAGALFNKTGYIKVWNGKEWEWTAAPAPHPTVTKIIHNGTTTITFFSDGKKVITRPSQDDLEKYDPFIGWCVGVVEHLYGGKEKAKKFYKKHAVVQKVKSAIVSPTDLDAVIAEIKAVEKEQEHYVPKSCKTCRYRNASNLEEPCESCYNYSHWIEPIKI